MTERIELPVTQGTIARYQIGDTITEVVEQPEGETNRTAMVNPNPPTRVEPSANPAYRINENPTESTPIAPTTDGPTEVPPTVEAPSANEPVREGGTRDVVDAGDGQAENGAVVGQSDVNAKTPLQEEDEEELKAVEVEAPQDLGAPSPKGERVS